MACCYLAGKEAWVLALPYPYGMTAGVAANLGLLAMGIVLAGLLAGRVLGLRHGSTLATTEVLLWLLMIAGLSAHHAWPIVEDGLVVQRP
jgi:hypothetical protein